MELEELAATSAVDSEGAAEKKDEVAPAEKSEVLLVEDAPKSKVGKLEAGAAAAAAAATGSSFFLALLAVGLIGA